MIQWWETRPLNSQDLSNWVDLNTISILLSLVKMRIDLYKEMKILSKLDKDTNDETHRSKKILSLEIRLPLIILFPQSSRTLFLKMLQILFHRKAVKLQIHSLSNNNKLATILPQILLALREKTFSNQNKTLSNQNQKPKISSPNSNLHSPPEL